MVTLLSCFFLLAAVEVQGIGGRYEIMKKFNCWSKVDLFLDRAILFSYEEAFLNSWPGYNRFDCQMVVYSRTKSTGILATIQQMKFRKNKADACIDYVKFSNDDTQRCGDILFGLSLYNNGSLRQPSTFVSEYNGPFVVNHNWPESKQLVSVGASVQPDKVLSVYTRVEKESQLEERLRFTIALTGFIDCDGFHIPRGMFNCGYGVCILDMFVGDGVVNCPFGDCRDEGSCKEAKMASRLFPNGNETNESSSEGAANRTELCASEECIAKRFDKVAMGKRVAESQDWIKGVEELKTIGVEFKRQNAILESISQVIESGIKSLRKE